MRAQAEWKVITHIAREIPPTSCATRSRISLAALLVNVIARISLGRARPVATSQAMRWVSTRVLPEPAPASTSSGPSPCVTALALGGIEALEQVLGGVHPDLCRGALEGLIAHPGEDSRAPGAWTISRRPSSGPACDAAA